MKRKEREASELPPSRVYTEKSVYTGSRDKDICFFLWLVIGLAGSVLFIGFLVWAIQALKAAL